MTPSAAPMILLYARVGRHGEVQGKPLAATGFFVAGYFLAWTAFACAATLGQWALESTLLLTPMMTSASGIFSGVTLIAVGLFQWTPLKDVCLRQCQAPVMFIHLHGGFRRDPLGSVALGFRHGIYCIGCCWALMGLLFIGGVMNVLWIAAVAIFVLAEKACGKGTLVFPPVRRRVVPGWVVVAGSNDPLICPAPWNIGKCTLARNRLSIVGKRPAWSPQPAAFSWYVVGAIEASDPLIVAALKGSRERLF